MRLEANHLDNVADANVALERALKRARTGLTRINPSDAEAISSLLEYWERRGTWTERQQRFALVLAKRIEDNNELRSLVRERKASHARIYIAKKGEHCKIGMSENPQERVRSMRTSQPIAAELVWTSPLAPRKDIEWVERRLHIRFAEHHVVREWFDADGIDIDEVKASFSEVLAKGKWTAGERKRLGKLLHRGKPAFIHKTGGSRKTDSATKMLTLGSVAIISHRRRKGTQCYSSSNKENVALVLN